MDEFLGCSDKVRPKSKPKYKIELEMLDKEKAVVESFKDSACPSGENVPQQRVRKRKRRQEEGSSYVLTNRGWSYVRNV